MRSLPLRRLIGLLALLAFAFALPMQASMGAPMSGCSTAGVVMDHDGGKSDCGKGSAPGKATMGPMCMSVGCATVSALPAQAVTLSVDDESSPVPAPTQALASLLTAPDPFPPRPTVRS